MSNIPSKPTVEVPIMNKTGSEDDGSLRTIHQTSSLSGESTNFSRSAVRVGTPTAFTRLSNDARYRPEPWMDTVTPGKFDRFQSTIFPIVEELTSKSRYANHQFTKKWQSLKRAPRTPMSEDITWRNVKVIMGISSLFQYKDYLQQCPEITKYIRIVPNNTTKHGFDYGVYEHDLEEPTLTPPSTPPARQEHKNPPAVTPKQVIEEFNTTDSSQAGLAVINASKPFQPFTQLSEPAENLSDTINDAPPQDVDINATPKRSNGQQEDQGTTPIELEILDVPTLATNNEQPKDIEWATNDETNDFREVHYLLFENVTTWMQQDDAKKHPFFQKWNKAVYEGLTALTRWARVAKIFKLSYLRDYINLMHECPRIRQRYELTWNYFENRLQYKELTLPESADILTDITKLNALQNRMQEMAFNFDKTMHNLTNRIEDINTSLTGCERGIVEQLNRVADRLAAKVTHHMTSIAEYATKSTNTFAKQIEELSAVTYASMKQKCNDLQESIINKTNTEVVSIEQRFEQRLEAAIECALQEIHSNADEATENMNAQAVYLMEHMEAKQKSSRTMLNQPFQQSKLFPNVDVEKLNQEFAHKRVQPENPDPPQREWNQDGPTDDRNASDIPTKEIVWSKDGPSAEV